MEFLEIKERLSKLHTACLCDADKSLRVMDPGIRPLFPDVKMIGTASSVRCRGDFLSVIKALDEAREDDVLVIDGGGERIALAGELFSHEAQRKGLAGIVLDGACRDSAKIRALQFPFYSRYITPMAGTASTIFATQIDVQCGGVQVLPGDIVFGDADGVVVLSFKEALAILDSASQIQETEDRVLYRMIEGESLLNLLNHKEHYEKIGRGESSQLKFTV